MMQRNPRDFVNSVTGERQVLWTPKQLAFLLGRVSSLRDRAYMSFVYLTACRECEPLPHVKRVKVFEEVRDVDGRRNRVWSGRFRSVRVDGFRVSQIQGVNRFDRASGRVVRFVDFCNLYVSKTRLDPSLSTRTVPVNVRLYRVFLEFIFDFVRSEGLGGDSVLFNFSGRTARKFVNKWLGVPVHFLRHLRLTHLKLLHGYDALDLRMFVRWKDTRPADVYVHMDPRDLALKQL